MQYDYSKPGARMSVSDGTLTIVAKNQSVMEKVQEKVLFVFYWLYCIHKLLVLLFGMGIYVGPCFNDSDTLNELI